MQQLEDDGKAKWSTGPDDKLTEDQIKTNKAAVDQAILDKTALRIKEGNFKKYEKKPMKLRYRPTLKWKSQDFKCYVGEHDPFTLPACELRKWKTKLENGNNVPDMLDNKL